MDGNSGSTAAASEALALPDPQASAEMLWSSDEATATGAIAAQSAALLLTTPK